MSVYAPQVGDIVRVGKGTTLWTVVELSHHGGYARVCTGVGRLGRRGRTISTSVERLILMAAAE